MRIFQFLVCVVLGLTFTQCNCNGEPHDGVNTDYLNDWVVEIEGGQQYAKTIAQQHGFHVVRSLRHLPNHYTLSHTDVPHRSKRSAHHHTQRLVDDSRITFAEQQHEKIRVKRSRLDNRDVADRIARSTGDLNDPRLIDQWYLNQRDEKDMGIKAAWKMGATGKGVVLTILDDGVEFKHPDIQPNYDPKASYDANDDDDDPSPRYDPTNENKHGTRCAGEIAMVANNNICGVGIAFNSKIGGVRMLDGKVTDSLEGNALGFAKSNVDITSASWGPNDDGRTLEGPGTAAMAGIMRSVREGRNGLGAIMVWAAGNGAHYGDNCNADGYTSSMYTLSVSSASEHGRSPWYAEKCASTLATTYSSGNHAEKQVVSSDLHGECTDRHTGTSASAPMAAGILALALEKNSNMTWRDMQHLVVATSRYHPLAGETGWYHNGAGFCVNHAFGFGLMDAGGLVQLASKWQPIGEQRACIAAGDEAGFPVNLSSGNTIEVEIDTDGCEGQAQEINYLEHIELVLSLEYSKRGNIYVELQSPSGTVTPLMVEREFDKSTIGFKRWPLMSVHTWGENPQGKWIVRISDKQKDDGQSGRLKDVKLAMYGTVDKPFYHDYINKEKCAHLTTSPTLIQNEVDEDPSEYLRHIYQNMKLTR